MSKRQPTVSLEKYFDAVTQLRSFYDERTDRHKVHYEDVIESLKTQLRETSQRAVEQAAEWTKERLESHNRLLEKWNEATTTDRANFVSKDSFDALKSAFDTMTNVLSKSQGKNEGVSAMWVAIGTVAGLSIGAFGVWASLHH